MISIGYRTGSMEEYRQIEQDAKVKTEFILLEMKQKL